MTEFGKLLADTFRACEGRSCVVLDRVLTAKVRAWADDQFATEAASLATYHHEPAESFEGVGRCS